MTDPTNPNPTGEPAEKPEAPEPKPAAEKPADDDGARKALEAERDAAKRAKREAHEAREAAEQAQAKLAALEAAERRRTVAAAKGLSAEQAKFLTGDDEDAMAAAADELLAAFARDEDQIPRRPMERLRPGAAPSAEPRDDMGSVADRVVKGW